jgi:hypothetical protein
MPACPCRFREDVARTFSPTAWCLLLLLVGGCVSSAPMGRDRPLLRERLGARATMAPPSDCPAGDEAGSGQAPCVEAPRCKACWCGKLCACLKPPVGPEAGSDYQVYPRFHPVPVQPVFSSRSGPGPGFGEADELKPSSAAPPVSAPLPQLPPSPPSPEAIPPPPPLGADNDADPSAPRRLGMAGSNGPSWVFSPPVPESVLRKMDPVVELKSDPAASKTAQQKPR